MTSFNAVTSELWERVREMPAAEAAQVLADVRAVIACDDADDLRHPRRRVRWPCPCRRG